MTSSFINETSVDQELGLPDLEKINGGWLQFGKWFVKEFGPDAAKFYYNFGKGLAEGKDWDNAAYDAGEESGYVGNSGGSSGNSTNVAPGPDGKGCTDRGLPF